MVPPDKSVSTLAVHCRKQVKLLAQYIEVLGIDLNEGPWILLPHLPCGLDSGNTSGMMLPYVLSVLTIVEFRMAINDLLDGRLTNGHSCPFQGFLDFILPQLKIFLPDVIYHLDDPGRGDHGSQMLGSSGLLVILQGFKILGVVSSFPTVKDAFGDPEVTTGSFSIPIVTPIPINPPETFLSIRRQRTSFNLSSGKNVVMTHSCVSIVVSHLSSNRSGSIAT